MSEPSAECASEAVQVVAAVIERADGAILMAQRPRGKVYEGYWEFPGGKIEPGESAGSALVRELHEELGIEVTCAYPWIARHYVYSHAVVDLHFFRVTGFRGELRSREGQDFRWQDLARIDVAPILPANGPIIAALRLPHVYAITNAAEAGHADFMASLEHALRTGLRLIQVREPHLSAAALEQLSRDVVERACAAGAKVLLNEDTKLAQRLGADGVHLKASQLRALGARPDVGLVGASCHDAAELERAVRLGVDFAVLGPVAPTLSHPGASPLGWDGFERLLRGCPIPVFALGGMQLGDLERAWACGAHGVSMQRGAWSRSNR